MTPQGAAVRRTSLSSDARLPLDDREAIVAYFFECLRARSVRIENEDLARQWIEQRIRRYAALVRPRDYIRAGFVYSILTRKFDVARLYTHDTKRNVYE